MIRKSLWLVASSAFLLTVLVAACVPGPTPATPPPVVDSSEGGKLFQANCSPCHGPDRMGSPSVAPALFLYGIKDADIHDTIANGVTGTAMPSFGDKLTAEQIDTLVKFIKTPPAGK